MNVETMGLNQDREEMSPLREKRKEGVMKESEVKEIIKQFNDSLDIQSQEKVDL